MLRHHFPYRDYLCSVEVVLDIMESVNHDQSQSSIHFTPIFVLDEVSRHFSSCIYNCPHILILSPTVTITTIRNKNYKPLLFDSRYCNKSNPGYYLVYVKDSKRLIKNFILLES